MNGKAYLVDAGTGVVRQANSAFQRGMPPLQPAQLDIVFLTHLHSDHILGLPDLILTPWIVGRTKPLRLYGPQGTNEMAERILDAYKQDIEVRTTGLEHANTTGYKIEAHDIQPGEVYKDANVTVTAFPVKHGSWKQAFGYRFIADGKTIVVSGDTSPVDSVVAACSGCDVLIHEVHAGSSDADWMKYERAFHTNAEELGDIASRARARTLVLMHWGLLGHASESDLLQAIREKYTGTIIVGRDLDVIAP